MLESIGEFFRSPDFDVLIFFVIIALLVLAIGLLGPLLLRKFVFRCPKCKKRGGLKMTGETEWRGWFILGRMYREFHCKNCGCKTWRRDLFADGGGG